MKVHEYQARQLLQQAGAAVPRFEVIESADQATAAWKKVGGGKVVVKAQVHAGGRGKAGYVVLSDNPAEIEKNFRRWKSTRNTTSAWWSTGLAAAR
jgi:succinyl-CoA synthetase beta subunit